MSAGSPDFQIQKATAAHAELIRKLIAAADLFQHGLDWRHFMVALTPSGEFIGCGQVKPHTDGTRELASIAVHPGWRGRGVGRALIEALLAADYGELYLMAMGSLESLYTKFGFETLSTEQMPKYFRRISRMPAMIAEFERVGERLIVMKRAAQ